MSDYFDPIPTTIAAGTRALASQVNAVANSISAGFDKLPTEPELKLGLTRYAVDTGVADAYIITLPYTPSLTDGFNYFVKTINENTGACTINVNSTGIKSLHNTDGSELVAGTLRANGIAIFAYESVGDHYILISQNPEQAALASVSAAEAAASAAAALVSENNAATSETNAATSETNAATSETNAEAAYDSFDDRYLGPKASDPTLDNDGDALLAGALYWNTTDNPQKMYGYDLVNTQWDPVFVSGDADTLDLLDSTQFLRSDVADTHSGGLLSVGDFQVTGDFTSLGIDDNATAERVSVSDTSLGIGDSASASSYSLLRRVNNGDMIISGGTLSTTGAALTLFGGVHGSRANDWEINAAGNRMMFWDQSAGDLEILTGSGAKTSAVNFAADQVVEFTTSMRMLERADHVRTPAATFGELWLRNDATQKLIFTDDAGTDFELNGAGGGIGGSDTQFQYNNGGVFGGIASFVYDDGAVGNETQFGITPNATLSNGGILDVTANLAGFTGTMLRLHQDNASSTGRPLVVVQDGNAIAASFFTVATTANCLEASSNNLTTGHLISLLTNDAGVTGALLDIVQDHASASAPGIAVQQDGDAQHIVLSGAGGTGIQFPATNNPSTDVNTLDDYEEISQTMGLQHSGGTARAILNTSFDAYKVTKIGRVVHCSGHVIFTTPTAGTAATVLMTLPFVTDQGNEADMIPNVPVYFKDLNTLPNQWGMLEFIAAGNGTATIKAADNNPIDAGEFILGADMAFAFFYTTDA